MDKKWIKKIAIFRILLVLFSSCLSLEFNDFTRSFFPSSYSSLFSNNFHFSPLHHLQLYPRCFIWYIYLAQPLALSSLSVVSYFWPRTRSFTIHSPDFLRIHRGHVVTSDISVFTSDASTVRESSRKNLFSLHHVVISAGSLCNSAFSLHWNNKLME